MGSWDMCSTDTNTVWSEWQVQLQHREYHDKAFWHAREQQTYQHVSNIYIPEQDMGDLIRKFYCGENNKTLWTVKSITTDVSYSRTLWHNFWFWRVGGKGITWVDLELYSLT